MKESWNYFKVIFCRPKTNVTDLLLRKLHFIHQNINIHQYHSLNDSQALLQDRSWIHCFCSPCRLEAVPLSPPSTSQSPSGEQLHLVLHPPTLLPSSNEQLIDSCRSFYGKSAFYPPRLISTTNYFQDYSIRIKVEHFHLFAALKDIVGSATLSSPGCREGGGSWSTSCPSWSSGHQDSSPVTHPDICK